MTTSRESCSARLEELKADLVAQGRRVQALIEASFDAAFSQSHEAADRVVAMDEEVDRIDVEIERSAVRVLRDATAASGAMSEGEMRMVLTIVKVNNELERIADRGVSIAEEVKRSPLGVSVLGPTFRVLTNSVIGIMRDSVGAFERTDGALAKTVLQSENTVEVFKRALLREAQGHVSRGAMSVDQVLSLQEIAMFAEIMTDHLANIAEQVLYAATGTIYRHMAGRWEEVVLPKAGPGRG